MTRSRSRSSLQVMPAKGQGSHRQADSTANSCVACARRCYDPDKVEYLASASRRSLMSDNEDQPVGDGLLSGKLGPHFARGGLPVRCFECAHCARTHPFADSLRFRESSLFGRREVRQASAAGRRVGTCDSAAFTSVQSSLTRGARVGAPLRTHSQTSGLNQGSFPGCGTRHCSPFNS